MPINRDQFIAKASAEGYTPEEAGNFWDQQNAAPAAASPAPTFPPGSPAANAAGPMAPFKNYLTRPQPETGNQFVARTRAATQKKYPNALDPSKVDYNDGLVHNSLQDASRTASGFEHNLVNSMSAPAAGVVSMLHGGTYSQGVDMAHQFTNEHVPDRTSPSDWKIPLINQTPSQFAGTLGGNLPYLMPANKAAEAVGMTNIGAGAGGLVGEVLKAHPVLATVASQLVHQGAQALTTDTVIGSVMNALQEGKLPFHSIGELEDYLKGIPANAATNLITRIAMQPTSLTEPVPFGPKAQQFGENYLLKKGQMQLKYPPVSADNIPARGVNQMGLDPGSATRQDIIGARDSLTQTTPPKGMLTPNEEAARKQTINELTSAADAKTQKLNKQSVDARHGLVDLATRPLREGARWLKDRIPNPFSVNTYMPDSAIREAVYPPESRPSSVPASDIEAYQSTQPRNIAQSTRAAAKADRDYVTEASRNNNQNKRLDSFGADANESWPTSDQIETQIAKDRAGRKVQPEPPTDLTPEEQAVWEDRINGPKFATGDAAHTEQLRTRAAEDRAKAQVAQKGAESFQQDAKAPYEEAAARTQDRERTIRSVEQVQNSLNKDNQRAANGAEDQAAAEGQANNEALRQSVEDFNRSKQTNFVSDEPAVAKGGTKMHPTEAELRTQYAKEAKARAAAAKAGAKKDTYKTAPVAPSTPPPTEPSKPPVDPDEAIPQGVQGVRVPEEEVTAQPPVNAAKPPKTTSGKTKTASRPVEDLEIGDLPSTSKAKIHDIVARLRKGTSEDPELVASQGQPSQPAGDQKPVPEPVPAGAKPARGDSGTAAGGSEGAGTTAGPKRPPERDAQGRFKKKATENNPEGPVVSTIAVGGPSSPNYAAMSTMIKEALDAARKAPSELSGKAWDNFFKVVAASRGHVKQVMSEPIHPPNK